MKMHELKKRIEGHREMWLSLDDDKNDGYIAGLDWVISLLYVSPLQDDPSPCPLYHERQRLSGVNHVIRKRRPGEVL